MGPMKSQSKLMIILLVFNCNIKIVTLVSGSNPHPGSLVCEVRTTIVKIIGKARKHLKP